MKLECPGLNLHRYHEDIDETKCYPINPELIKQIENRGWIIEDKLAEGSIADVFNVFNVLNTKAVIIILGNTDSNYPDISEKLKFAGKFPEIFPYIYDHFNLNIPYSTDINYINSTGNFGNKTIHIIEKMDMTLYQYLLQAKVGCPQFINDIIEDILQLIINYLNILRNNGLTYTDLKLENIGVSRYENDIDIKLLDIEGLHLHWTYEYDSKESVERLYEYEIIPLFQ